MELNQFEERTTDYDLKEADETDEQDHEEENDDDDNDNDGNGGLTELVRDVVGEIFGAPLVRGFSL